MVNKLNIIRQFTPNWFTTIMGTGVVAIILGHSSQLHTLGAVLWLINTCLFCVFCALYSLRWYLFPNEAKQIFHHPSMSLFLGAIPMALATLINGLLMYGNTVFGQHLPQLGLILWYIDVVLVILIGLAVPYLMFSRQQHHLHSITAMWLLPIVAAEVVAATGGLLVAEFVHSTQAISILWLSYMLWGMSVLPAFGILSLLILRLALHQLPEKELAISSWLSIGPIGTGALAMMLLGQHAPEVLQSIGLESFGIFLQQAAKLISLVLLGCGVWWLGIATLASLHHVKRGIPFNLGWWGLTFPLGVFTLAVNQLGELIGWGVLDHIAVILSVILIGLWSCVAVKTIQGAYHGQLFFSPCLQQLQQQQKTHAQSETA